jgi:hypothetical protein
MFSRRTRAITEAVGIYLAVSSALLLTGVVSDWLPGLYVGLAAISIARLIQTIWLWYRSRAAMRRVEQRDAEAMRVEAADVGTH